MTNNALGLDHIRGIAMFHDVIIRKRNVYARLAFKKVEYWTKTRKRRSHMVEIKMKSRGAFQYKGYLCKGVGTNAANVAIDEGRHA